MRRLCIWLTMFAVGGCAITPRHFEQSREKMTDYQVCKAGSDADKSGNASFVGMVGAEWDKRSLTRTGCTALIADEDRKAALVLAAVLIGAAAIAAAKSGGGSPSASYATDLQWDWDLFHDQHGQLVWACRGVQTGQFADVWRCNGLLRSDARWPGR
jgi:hypothetical protein